MKGSSFLHISDHISEPSSEGAETTAQVCGTPSQTSPRINYHKMMLLMAWINSVNRDTMIDLMEAVLFSPIIIDTHAHREASWRGRRFLSACIDNSRGCSCSSICSYSEQENKKDENQKVLCGIHEPCAGGQFSSNHLRVLMNRI